MKKRSALSFCVLSILMISIFTLVLADNSTNITNSTVIINTPSPTANLSNADKGFSCLSSQVGSDCSGATTIQQIALTILASPNVTQACYDKLKTMEKSASCFGDGSACDIQDTAMAILALNHVGDSTTDLQSWLMNQTLTADNLVWYLEQDSTGQTGCQASYNSQQYQFNVGDNKKIDSSAGNCLSLANSNYWFQVDPSCYNKDITVVCDQGFIVSLLYKEPNSPTVYVLSDTKSAAAVQPVTVNVKSSCFGAGTCNYEASLWATLALQKTGKDITQYLPYLISGDDTNTQYLPDAFLNIVADYSEYGTKLVNEQTFNYWLAQNSAYNKYYDTALALLALNQGSQQQVVNAQNWLLYLAQDVNGCWNSNNIRDTAMILWALEGKSAGIIGSTSIPDCIGSGFSCMSSSLCSNILSNYNCAGTKVCCQPQSLQTCTALSGTVCQAGYQCSGTEVPSSDETHCCTTSCEVTSTTSECESAGSAYSCRSACSGSYVVDPSSKSCGDVSLQCCMLSQSTTTASNLTWLWIVLAVLIILIILGIFYREKIKMWVFKTRSKFSEEKKTPPSNSASQYRPMSPMNRMPPARPLPTQNRGLPPRQMPMQNRGMPQPVKKPADNDDIFKKLRDMGK